MSLPDPLRRLIERALDLLLSLDADTATALEPLDGRCLRVQAREPSIDVALRIERRRLVVVDPESVVVDATIRGRIADILSLRTRRDAIYTGDVEIEGDLGFAQELADVLGGIRPDLVEPLARTLGDAPATRIGDAARQIAAWATRSAVTLRQGATEYLRDDARVIVTRTELDTRFEAIETLRADVDRVEARLARLEQVVTSGPPD